MARRPTPENGLKYQQRIESQQPRQPHAEPPPEAPVPPGLTQLFDTAAPPPFAPREPHEPHEP